MSRLFVAGTNGLKRIPSSAPISLTNYRSSRVLRSIPLLAATLIIVSGCSKAPTPDIHPGTIATTQWIDKKFGFVADPEVRKLTNRVTQRLGESIAHLAAEAGVGGSELERFKRHPWQTFVINSDQANAFSPGGGVIFLSRGLFRELQTESQLAAVVAHEMAHEVLGHTSELREKRETGSAPQFTFSLEHELSADSLSMSILRNARYNPREAIRAISELYRSRMRAGSEVNEAWLGERLAQLQRQLLTQTPSTAATTTSTEEYDRVRQILATTRPQK